MPALVSEDWFNRATTERQRLTHRFSPLNYPFVPVGQSGFGTAKTLSVVLYGLAPGFCELNIERNYVALADHLEAELDYQFANAKRGLNFWHFGRVVHTGLSQRFENVRLGWANLFPINHDDRRPAPSRSLKRAQMPFSRDLFLEVCRSNAEAIVATWGPNEMNLETDTTLSAIGRWEQIPELSAAVFTPRANDHPMIFWFDHPSGRHSSYEKFDRHTQLIVHRISKIRNSGTDK